MYVAPEFARRGIGRALVRHVIAEATREPGLEQLVLTVTHSNDAARTLYESEGFRSFGVEPRAIRVGDRYLDKNHMVRFLERAGRDPSGGVPVAISCVAPSRTARSARSRSRPTKTSASRRRRDRARGA
jgi:ribosomal protein S18 acetylase RimI-like enzyme